jgi:ribose transport system substrate-binding protein
MRGFLLFIVLPCSAEINHCKAPPQLDAESAVRCGQSFVATSPAAFQDSPVLQKFVRYFMVWRGWPLTPGIRIAVMITRRAFMPVMALGLTNCGQRHRKTLAVIPKANADLFFLTVRAGAERAAGDLDVAMTWNGPDHETEYSRQIQIVDATIARGVDGIAISATDDTALAGPLERAIRAGIPVTLFDSAAKIENYVSLIATDNYGAGCTAARSLAALLPETSAVAMLMQKPGGTSTELREHGFEETMAKEFPRLTIVARQFGMGDRAKSVAIAENILTAHPSVGGLFASSEACSLGAIRAIRARGLGGKIRLITFDVSDIHIEALRDGTAHAMLVQDAFRIGYETVKSLTDKLAGRAPARRLDIPARVLVKADLEKPEVLALLSPGLTKK